MKRAGVDASNGTGAIDFVDYRISKSAWLFDHHHKYVNDISIRVKDMTGMSMDTAEELQVVNYGIGGFYDTHHDYAPVDDTAYDDAGIGNRIGTVLFYVIHKRKLILIYVYVINFYLKIFLNCNTDE